MLGKRRKGALSNLHTIYLKEHVFLPAQNFKLMQLLDQKTLLIVVCSITFLMGILMLHFRKNNPLIVGPSYWSLGSFLIVLGVLFFLFYPEVESFAVLVLASTIIIMGISFYFAGMQAFNGKKVNFVLVFGIPVFEFIQAVFFYSVTPVPWIRMTLYSSINVLLAILIIREFIRPPSKSYHIAYFSGLIVFVIFGLTSLSRAVFAAFYQPVVALGPGKVNVILFFFHNITQTLLLFVFVLMISVRLTESLNKKIANQQKFFSIVAHDLNGPVGSISEILSFVNANSDFPEIQKNELLKELEKTSRSTHELLQNLLFWSMKQMDGLRPVIEKFDLNEMIEKSLVLLRHISKTKNISIEFTPAGELYCIGDVRMIEIVIRNLVSNSIKFSHSGGKISIYCEKSETEIRIKISDNGIGMNKETLKGLLDSKKKMSKTGTLGERGTGLGLMLCRDFVEENKGTMHIQSQENIGTEVVLSFISG